MLRWRLLLGTLIVGILAELFLLDLNAGVAGLWLLPVAVIVAVLATDEVLGMAALAQLQPLRWTVYCGNILLVVSGWLAMFQSHWLGSWFSRLEHDTCPCEFGALAALGVGVLLVLFGELCRYRKPGGNTANVAAGVFALVYVGFMLSLAVQLRLRWGVGALASWIVVVKMGDIGAYTVGRLIGRHKMAPLLSPGKTIEGAAGSLAFSLLGSWFTFGWLVPLIERVTFLPKPSPLPTEQWWGWIAFGLLVGTAGMVGDLAESLLKRDVGRKDSSGWLPGFGGVLDIVDSLLISAPVAWFCWASGMAGR